MTQEHMEPMRLSNGTAIIFPLVATQSAVYDQIEDAEGGLICFMSMHEDSARTCQYIVDLMNADCARRSA